MENKDFTKDFFQEAWGADGYYETFSYGVGFDKVCEVGLYPFFDLSKTALEIGPGGGTFTKRMIGNFERVIALDVIKKPKQFDAFNNFLYVELEDKCYDCKGIESASVDFCFSYNVFCHLSNNALKKYISNIHRALKPGADFVFMLANYDYSKAYFPTEENDFKLGDMTPIGHFYQDDRTIDLIIHEAHWEIVSRNMLPEHRDIIVHLKKK